MIGIMACTLENADFYHSYIVDFLGVYFTSPSVTRIWNFKSCPKFTKFAPK